MSAKHSTNHRIPTLGYYRRSTDKEEQGASIPQQREWAARAAGHEGLDIRRSFEDDAISGGKIEQRAGLVALLDEAERAAAGDRPYGALICWNLDRLSRADSMRTAGVIARLMDAGIYRIFTVKGWTDLSQGTHRVLFNLEQDFGRHSYLESLSENCLRGLKHRAESGRFCGSLPPFGYDAGPDGFLVPNAYAEAARRLFADYLAGATLAELAHRLNDQKIPAPRGGRWRRNTIRNILGNRAYRGDMVYNATHSGTYNRISKAGIRRDDQATLRQARRRRLGQKTLRRERNTPEDEVVKENAHPALVSREEFAEVQRCLRQRAGDSCGRGKTGVVWTLSGILHCGCGRVMHAAPRKTRTRIYRYYQCSGRCDLWPRTCSNSGTAEHDLVVKEVVRLLKDHLGSPEAIAGIRQRLQEEAEAQSGTLDAEAAALERQAAELDGWIKQGNRNLAILPEDRVAGVVEQLRAWEQQRLDISSRLAALDVELTTEAGHSAEDVERALSLLDQLDELVERAQPSLIRAALVPLIQKVTLYFRPATKKDRQKKGGGNPRFRVDKLAVEPTPLLLNLLSPAMPSVPTNGAVTKCERRSMTSKAIKLTAKNGATTSR
jgi:DNA invertase Pin-like site-specific DNA recombinase